MRRWHWFALSMVPLLAWGIVLAVAPTDWARTRLVDRLARATGRSVEIGSIRLGVFGELRIVDLTMAEPSTPTDPWLRVAEAKIDVRLGQVLTGQCDLKEVQVEGVSLRIRRRADGSSELADLLLDDRVTPRGRASGTPAEGPGSIAVRVSGGRVRFVDEADGRPAEPIELTGIEARATVGRRSISIDDLRGKLNGGTIAMAAKLDRDPRGPRFEVEARARGIEIARGMSALGLLVPVIAGPTEGVGGKLDLIFSVHGRGKTLAEVRRSIQGRGSVMVDPIDLEGSRFLHELDVLGDWPKETRFGSVSSDFQVQDQRITTEDLTIQASSFPFVLGGWTDFDGRFDYAARVDKITSKLPREARGWMADLKVNFDQLAGLRLRGTIDQVEVTIHGHPLTGDPDRPDQERAKFRDTARRIRDRFFR